MAACTGFTQDAVCTVADMMYNRCEAVRGADVCSCPRGLQSCPLLSHLPQMPHKASNNLASLYIHVYLCVAASKSMLNAVMCYNLSISGNPLTHLLQLIINTLQDRWHTWIWPCVHLSKVCPAESVNLFNKTLTRGQVYGKWK